MTTKGMQILQLLIQKEQLLFSVRMVYMLFSYKFEIQLNLYYLNQSLGQSVNEQLSSISMINQFGCHLQMKFYQTKQQSSKMMFSTYKYQFLMYNQDEKKVIVFVGHTQTGKSSTIKDLTGDQSIVCGKPGNGGSTTKAIKIHQPKTPKLKDEYIFMDTIGAGDNTLKFTPEAIREEIELNILALSSTNKCDTIQGIVITQSLKDSSHQLRNNLKFITQIFGDLPNKSLVILGTKGHKQDQDDLHERQKALMDIMKQYDIPQNQYIRFDTSYPKLPQQSINEEQYKRLETALKNCSMINANNSIKEKKNKIDEIAKRIQKEKTQIKKQQYIHTWTEQRWKGDIGKILGIKENKQFSQPRQRTTTHVPKLEQCYGLALKQFEQGVRQKLLKMK